MHFHAAATIFCRSRFQTLLALALNGSHAEGVLEAVHCLHTYDGSGE
jgi:hypothetical protein